MSLDVLAQNLASRGRNGDSMLVHMTPGEVHGLHALALAHGGQLTINPETGLPEANFLKKLLPMIAGAALNFFAPGIGTAIGSALGGLSGAAGSAIAVGGITGLATGSLQKGLMAGLGAYGGAGLTEAFAGAGASAAGAASIEAAQKMAMEKGLEGELANKFVQDEVAKSVASYGAKPFMEQMTGGINALGSPMAAAKAVAKPLMYAASPIMADAMVPTTTGMPSTKPGDTGYIRPFVYDAATFGQGPQGLQALAPIPANQITYPAPPPGGANGGLVAFAAGGPVMPSDIGKYTADQKADLYNKFLSQGFGDAAIRQAAGVQEDSAWKTLQDLAAQRGSPAVSGAERYALTTPDWQSKQGLTGIAGLNQNIQSYFADQPGATYKDIASEASKYGVDTADIQRALEAGGGSGAMQLVTTTPTWQSKSGETGLAGLSSNINKWFAENPNATRAQVESEMGKWLLNEADIRRATGKTLAEMFPTPPATQPPATQPPATQPPATQPPATQPPATQPPATQPPATQPPAAAPAAAPATSTVAPGPVTGGTVTGGGVFTSRTDTTPTFQLAPAEQVMKTPVGTITGGTVTGAVDTQKALNDYNRTAPTGKPVDVIDSGTRAGYTGTDKTYGGTDKLDQIKLKDLGTAGSVTRGTETMQDVRNAVGNRYAAPVFQYTPPSVTGASKSAYDYLMGRGDYPTQQTLPGNAPLWRPYVQNVTTPPSASDAFVSRTAPTTATTGGAQFGFTPPTGSTGTPVTGTQRWKNSKTGEIYLAPAGYSPPSGDWVLDDNTTDLTNSGVGVGSDSAGGATGVGPGSAADGGVGSADGSAYAVGGITALAGGYAQGGYNLGSYSDGGRLLRGPGDGVSDSIPATIGRGQPARLADGEFVIPARIVSELGNGSTEAGARKLYAMMDRVQRARRKTTGKNRVAANTKADRLLPA